MAEQFSIPCLVFNQRDNDQSPTFAVFVSPASQVLKWAAIRRREDENEGPQRKPSRARIKAVQRFFNLDARNTIPTAITVALNLPNANWRDIEAGAAGGVAVRFLDFEIEDDVADLAKPGLVIDGQHRLLGMAGFDEHCMVSVVALLNVDDMEQAFQFLVINDKAAKVPTDHIRTLALDYQADELAERLKTARVALHDNLKYVGIMDSDASSPFAGHIKLVTNQGDESRRFVNPSTIENSVAYIQQKKVREFENDDALCEFFYAIWSPIKEQWPELWESNSKLMNKVGVMCMTTYMTEALVARYDWGELDIADPDAVRRDVVQLLRSQTAEFWKSEWNITINDSKVVRDIIVQALTQIARNIRAGQTWSDELEIVSL